MKFVKVRSFLLAVMIGLAAALISLGALGMMSPAQAQEPELEVDMPAAQASPIIAFSVFFTGPVDIDIQDLGGVVIGQGTHMGKIRCKNKCSQKTQLQLNSIEYDYKFKEKLAIDPVARRAVVAGTGTKNSNGQREKFLFTATFQDNGDGTVEVIYNASKPVDSFIVPRAPGTMTFSGE